jgi:hypothetical protein
MTESQDLSSIRRVMLLNREPAEKDSDSYILTLRHYAIATKKTEDRGWFWGLMGGKRDWKIVVVRVSSRFGTLDSSVAEKDSDSYILTLRHYAIATKKTGVSKRIRRLDPKDADV